MITILLELNFIIVVKYNHHDHFSELNSLTDFIQQTSYTKYAGLLLRNSSSVGK